jgi:hypothetical protein
MSFSKSLFSASLLAGVVFSIAVTPLALLGAKPLTIQFGQRPVFAGQLRDLSMPYLSVVTTASLGLGVASLALAGWRQSSQQISQYAKKMSELDQQLQEKKALIEDLAFSEAKLKALGLETFLDQGTGLEPQMNRPGLFNAVASYSGHAQQSTTGSETVPLHPQRPHLTAIKLGQMQSS